MINQKVIKDAEQMQRVLSSEQLTLTFNAKDYLLTTEVTFFPITINIIYNHKLFKFYKEVGMELTNVTLVIEYSKDRPLKQFIDKMVQCRKDADRANQKDLVQIYKLVVNSSYGQLGMDMSKFKHVRYESMDQKLVYGPLVVDLNPVQGEFDSRHIEITCRKTSITDNTAIHLSFFILQNSKLHILRYVYFPQT